MWFNWFKKHIRLEILLCSTCIKIVGSLHKFLKTDTFGAQKDWGEMRIVYALKFLTLYVYSLISTVGYIF